MGQAVRWHSLPVNIPLRTVSFSMHIDIILVVLEKAAREWMGGANNKVGALGRSLFHSLTRVVYISFNDHPRVSHIIGTWHIFFPRPLVTHVADHLR
jgi:hypothetical protein